MRGSKDRCNTRREVDANAQTDGGVDRRAWRTPPLRDEVCGVVERVFCEVFTASDLDVVDSAYKAH